MEGFVHPAFEEVRQAFVENFERGYELGAACCIYYRGEKVVDLWGGVRDATTGAPWEEDTMVIVYSTTKGMAGLAMALAHSRGLFGYDDRVATFWPQFAQQGKAQITVRQLLSHQAGLFALDQPLDAATVSDPDRLAAILARQKPAWEPGTRQAYHGITLGFYESELLRRVDPKHRTLGQFFQEELADPLGLDFFIRLPESIPDRRLGRMQRFALSRAILALPLPTLVAAMNPRSRFRRCLAGSELPEQTDRIYARNLEVPAGGGVGTARAMAHVYGVFAEGGGELGLREETLRELMAPPVPPLHGFRDACLKVEVPFSLGFAKPGRKNTFAHQGAFGGPGTGGSLGFADPESKVGFAYFPNRMSPYLLDPRAEALRSAMYRSIGETDRNLIRRRSPRRVSIPDPRRERPPKDPRRTPPFRGPDGAPIPGSLAEVRYLRLGGVDQWVMIRGESTENPPLIFLHGGPGFGEMRLFRHFNAPLEKAFTVVHWDQRGSGKSYDRRIPPGSMTVDQLLSDLDGLVDWVRSRLGKEKVVLFGHSWGTALGVLYAARFPEKVAAYVGSGQIGDWAAGEAGSYAFALAEARRQGNRRALRALRAIGPPPHDAKQLWTQRTWLQRLEGSLDAAKLWRTGRIFLAGPEVSLLDLPAMLRGFRFSLDAMWAEVSRLDLTARVPALEVPVFLFLGRRDHWVPPEQSEAFFDALVAPSKQLVWFEASGHEPFADEPERFNTAMVDLVRPVALREAAAHPHPLARAESERGEGAPPPVG